MRKNSWLRAASLTGLLLLFTGTQAGCTSLLSKDIPSDEISPLTPEEHGKRADRLFQLMDRNRDGRLSKREMTEGLRSRSAAGTSGSYGELMLGLKPKVSKAGKPTREKPQPMTDEDIRQTIENAIATKDSDLDEHLSVDEFRKMVLEKSDTSAPWQKLL